MNDLLHRIRAAKDVVILGHVRPDGDCAGACLGLARYIKDNYPDKPVTVCLKDVPEKFAYLYGYDDIKTQAEKDRYDLCICLDAADRDRLGTFLPVLEAAEKSVCVDHHITNPGYCDLNIIDPDASSASELVFSLLEEDKVGLPAAECFYTGIIHDTNVFKNSNTTPATMQAAAKLMAKGVEFGRIIDESFYRKTYAQTLVLGHALLHSIEFLSGRAIFGVLKLGEKEFYGVSGSDLDGIVDQLRVVEGVEVAIFMHEVKAQEYKVSLRSGDRVDVSRVAAYFGGGGHVRAAGCNMCGNVHDVVMNLARRIEEQLGDARL